MANVAIRERKNLTCTTYQVVFDKGLAGNGKKKREYYTFKTKKEAQEMKAKLLNDFYCGTHIDAVKMTVKQLCEEWFQCHVKKLAPNTQRGYKVNLEKHIYPYLGDVQLKKLRPNIISACYDKLMEKGLNATSIRYVHRVLHGALQYGYMQELIGKNFADFVTLPKETKYKPSVYNTEELKHLLSVAKGHKFEMPIYIAATLGMRRGEILGLQWQDIDFVKNTITISHNLTEVNGKVTLGRTKTDSSNRELGVPESLMRILSKEKKRQSELKLKAGGKYNEMDLVCCTVNGMPYHPGKFSYEFSKFLEKNNLRHCRFHDLRHANASSMLEIGLPMKTVSERLGHSDIGITMNLYAHVSDAMKIEAANAINDALFSNALGA